MSAKLSIRQTHLELDLLPEKAQIVVACDLGVTRKDDAELSRTEPPLEVVPDRCALGLGAVVYLNIDLWCKPLEFPNPVLQSRSAEKGSGELQSNTHGTKIM
jgi:hypothetical protein